MCERLIPLKLGFQHYLKTLNNYILFNDVLGFRIFSFFVIFIDDLELINIDLYKCLLKKNYSNSRHARIQDAPQNLKFPKVEKNVSCIRENTVIYKNYTSSFTPPSTSICRKKFK